MRLQFEKGTLSVVTPSFLSFIVMHNVFYYFEYPVTNTSEVIPVWFGVLHEKFISFIGATVFEQNTDTLSCYCTHGVVYVVVEKNPLLLL